MPAPKVILYVRVVIAGTVTGAVVAKSLGVTLAVKL